MYNVPFDFRDVLGGGPASSSTLVIKTFDGSITSAIVLSNICYLSFIVLELWLGTLYSRDSFSAVFRGKMFLYWRSAYVELETLLGSMFSINGCDMSNLWQMNDVTYGLIVTCMAAFAVYGYLQHSLLGNRNTLDIGINLVLFFLCSVIPIVDVVFFSILPTIFAILRG
jgi:hypothetical protein